MGVENLKRWHWMLIGLGLGLVLAYVQLGLDSAGGLSGAGSSLGQAIFERALLRPPSDGRPIIKNLRVFSAGDKLLVKCSYLENTPDSKTVKGVDYRESTLTTSVPFEPVTDLTKTVYVAIHPEMADPRTKQPGVVRVNHWPRPVGADFKGWQTTDSNLSDPGKDAEIGLRLRAANYRLDVSAPAATSATISGLSITLNGRALAPLVAAPQPAGGTLWQTIVPKDAFVATDHQVLHFARGDQPVGIREITLLDPTYSVVDYLRETATTHNQVSFRIGWWAQPKTAIPLWTLGCVVLVGGVWPTVINLLTGGAARRATTAEPTYDLERFNRGPEPEPAVQPTVAAPPVNDRLAAIEEELLKSMTQSECSTVSEPELQSVPPAPVAAPRALNAGPLVAPAANDSPEPKKDFAGVYYPVRRADKARGDEKGFSLVELMVVIGIIAVLVAILLPALARAPQQANTVKCMSNMRQVGIALLNYSNHWKGVMFPPLLGDNQPVTNRWPVFVFDPPVYNPPILTCPSDLDPDFEHSYILNSHLTEHNVTYSNTQSPNVNPSQVIVMGEKLSSVADYYMDENAGDYTTKVDFYKHGLQYGSNYLFLDIHVETQLPKDSQSDIDPWDPVAPPAP